jgi:hypothetical protein
MNKVHGVVISGPLLLCLAFLPGCGGQSPNATSAAVAPSPPAPSPSPTPSPTPANPNAKTIPDIQKLTGWETCSSTCSNTAPAVFSMTQGISSPSLSGSSTRFQLLAGTQPFGGVLWFKFVGTENSATHFVYDLFFLVDNPGSAQALEFNVSQSAGGNRYSFSTQLDIAGQNTWRVWDPVANRWVASTVHSPKLEPNTWNHLIWEFERDSGGNVIFTAVTVNGTRGVVNLSMPHTADPTSGLDVAFQANANLAATPYSVWLDKVNLTFW